MKRRGKEGVKKSRGNPSLCKVPTGANTDGQMPGICGHMGDAHGSHGAQLSLIIIQRNKGSGEKMGIPEP